MSQQKLKEILQLPYVEKLEIYQALILNLREEHPDQEIPDWEKEELNRRLSNIESGADKLITWNDIKEKYGMK